jgi:hypothetical protein
MSTQAENRAFLAAIGILVVWVLLWNLDALFGQNLWFFHDLRHHHYPWRVWAQQAWASGDLPLWAPVAHGYPLMADGQAGVLYPPNLLLYSVLPANLAFTWSMITHHLLAATGGVVLAKVLGRSMRAALLAGLIFGFSGFLITKLVYLGMFQSAAWMPWAVALVVRGTRGDRVAWVLAGGVIGLSWLAGHPQMALYVSYAAAWVALWQMGEQVAAEGVKPVLPHVAAFVGMVALAVLIAAPQLVGSAELASFGYRDGGVDEDFAAMGGLPLEEVFNGVFPYPFGYERPSDILVTYHHRADLYIGRGVSFLEDAFYFGVIPGLLALIAGRTRQARMWWALAAVGLLVALGPATPFYSLARLLPGMGWFRFPVRATVWVVLAVSQLAPLGVDRLGSWLIGRPEYAARVARLSFAVVVLGFVLGGAARLGLESVREPLTEGLTQALVRPPPTPEMLAASPAGAPPPEARGPEEAGARARALIASAEADVTPWGFRLGVPLFLIFGFALAIDLALRGRIGIEGPSRIAVALTAVDLWMFGYDFNPTTPTPSAIERPVTAIPMLGVAGPFRSTVFDRRVPEELDRYLLSSNLGMIHGLEDVIIPSPLRLVRNETYLAEVGLDLGITTPEHQLAKLTENRRLADLSGIRFLLTTHELTLPDLALVKALEVPLDAGGAATVRVYENERAFERAFVVGCVEEVVGHEQALARLLEVDPAEVAVVEREDGVPFTPLPCGAEGAPGVAQVRRKGMTGLTVDLELTRDAWLVITETRYPGQVVTLDGVPVATLQTDDLFQGIRVPAGTHVVEWEYAPIFVLIAMMTSTFTMTCLGIGVVFVRRLKK